MPPHAHHALVRVLRVLASVMMEWGGGAGNVFVMKSKNNLFDFKKFLLWKLTVWMIRTYHFKLRCVDIAKGEAHNVQYYNVFNTATAFYPG